MEKRKLKKYVFQKTFCILSIAFIIIVIAFYASRILINSRIYGKELISTTISKNKTVEKVDKTYIFRGSKSNNYIMFSNMLFRIVKVNIDGSVDIVLDDSMNSLIFNTDNGYIDSDIHEYLNDVFLDKLNKNYLTNTIICTDTVSDLNKYSCKNKETKDYVKLLDVADYLNSIDEDTYIKNNGVIWLSTVKDKENTWVINNGEISYLKNDSFAMALPVVTLKDSVKIVSGDGTKEKPYRISNKTSIDAGSYIKINDDLWVVYSKDKNTVNLVLYDNINSGITKFKYSGESIKFDPKEDNTLAKYLNDTYYNSLTYKKLLKDFEICSGEYSGSYTSVCKNKTKVKVGIPTILDIKYPGNSFSYYLANGIDSEIYYYEDGIHLTKPNLIKPIRPTISIKTPSTKKGKGTLEEPYIVEVK